MSADKKPDMFANVRGLPGVDAAKVKAETEAKAKAEAEKARQAAIAERNKAEAARQALIHKHVADAHFWRGAIVMAPAWIISTIFLCFAILALARENISLERWTAKRDIQSDQLLLDPKLSDDAHPEAIPGK